MVLRLEQAADVVDGEILLTSLDDLLAPGVGFGSAPGSLGWGKKERARDSGGVGELRCGNCPRNSRSGGRPPWRGVPRRRRPGELRIVGEWSWRGSGRAGAELLCFVVYW